jgi:YVTN family beta-propeller protein
MLVSGPRLRSRRGLWRVLVCLAVGAVALALLAVDVDRFLYGGASVLRVGASPGPLVVSPDGRTIYLADSTDSITPVSAATGKAGKRIAISGGSPSASGSGRLAITPDGQTLFATVFSDAQGNPLLIARVDLRTGKETGQIRVPGASDFVLSPDGTTLYVASLDNTLTAVDTATDRPERRIPVPGNLLANEVAMVLSPDGGTLYVATSDASATVTPASGAVTPVSLRTGMPGRAVSVGWEPASLAITPDGRTLYAAVDGLEGESGQVAPNRVVAIDTATDRVRASLPWQAPPCYLAMAPDGATVWVVSIVGGRSSTAENTVTPVSVVSGQPGPSFRTSGWLNDAEDQPSGVAVNPDGRALYVTVTSGLETFGIR